MPHNWVTARGGGPCNLSSDLVSVGGGEIVHEPKEATEKAAAIFGTPRSKWPQRAAVAVVGRQWGYDPARLWNWHAEQFDTVDSPAMLIKWAVENKVGVPSDRVVFELFALHIAVEFHITKLVLDQTINCITCRCRS